MNCIKLMSERSLTEFKPIMIYHLWNINVDRILWSEFDYPESIWRQMIQWFEMNNAEIKLIFPGILIHKGNSMLNYPL